MLYAIINVKTKKYVIGTDFRYKKPRQIISNQGALLFTSEEEARQEFERRGCGKTYKICKVKAKIRLVDILE